MFNESNIVSGEAVLHSPAKVNLMLSVHGRRADGFHELTSLIVALKFGDTLTVRISDSREDSLTCSNLLVPLGSENLILKAASAFRGRLKQLPHFDFHLEKRIPMGAGLGGGSSNAVAALSGMNQLLGEPLEKEALHELAAELGSDCTFFIEAEPAWMRGRGERIERLHTETISSLRGKRLILFKPDFGVETAWAYQRLVAKAPSGYHKDPINRSLVEQSVEKGSLKKILYNSFEIPVGEKYLAIPALLRQLRALNIACMMSGSGSTCFALIDESTLNMHTLKKVVQDAWGESVFWVETSIR